MKISGNEILAKALKRQGVDTFFFLMGGPMTGAEGACISAGMRGIDVRHEQAAAMMAHAYARVQGRPAVCIAASGPGTTNLVTGIANAFDDCAPVVAIGGSSAIGGEGLGAFQEMDQVSMMRPITRWSRRCFAAGRIPEMVDAAFRNAFSGRPGPVYLDIPGDVILARIDESEVNWEGSTQLGERQRLSGDPVLIDRAVDLIAVAKRPIVVAGGGVLWSKAAVTLRAFVENAGIPFYTTPISRGLIPEDHPLSHVHARSTAFREADLVFVCGTRLNYIIQHGRPPRFSADARFIQVDIEPTEIGRTRRVEVGIVGDVDSVVRQMIEAGGDGRLHPGQHAGWNKHLDEISSSKRDQQEEAMSTDHVPIHPLRLCKEVRDFLPRDAYLVVDGREILTYARQSISTYEPGHRLNPGPFGTMGVGVPYAIGAKVAAPDKMVVVLHGDGSFGLNAMEMDTALRHHINVLCVISNNGGWTAANNLDTDGRVLALEPGQVKAGRDLGFTRYDLMFQAIGCHGEHVESPGDIAPALRRAGESGKPAVINVVTDPAARAQESYDLPDRTDIKYPEPAARRPTPQR